MKIYRGYDQAELDAQYNLRAAVADHPAYFARWAETSRAVRERHSCRLDVAYGPGPKETLDFFPASASAPTPLLVFIHGGFWQAMDKSDFSFIAPDFLAAGIGVAVINYALAPSVGMDEIVAQSRAALVWLVRNAGSLGIDIGRVAVSGHSAGGHLAALMLLTDWAALGIADPVSVACAISGIFDLEPLRLSFHNRALALDAASVARNSPARVLDGADFRRLPGTLILSVGGAETAEFLRQQAEFAALCGAAGIGCEVVSQNEDHHFSIMDGLSDRRSPLHRAIARAISSQEGKPRA
ncbi:MAG: alpha/beta hydrolase [Alphaproteobacteria bacterium]|nr:alpha/beta hydrolase [Alphaproteobacteria bacterium]